MGNVLAVLVPMVPAIVGLAMRTLHQSFPRPDRQNPTHADIQARYRAEQAQLRAERSAREAHELAERIWRQADQDREQARSRQEEANQAAAQAAREVQQMRRQMEDAVNAANRAQVLSEAAANTARDEAMKITRETHGEREHFQRMREEVERAMAAMREDAGRVHQAVDGPHREAEAGMTLIEEPPCTTTDETETAIQAKDETERCLTEDIQHIVAPTSEKVTVTKRRIMPEDAETTMAAVRVQQSTYGLRRQPEAQKAKDATADTRYWKQGIQPVVTPTPEELAATERRIIREEAEKAMAAMKEEAERAQQAADERRRQAEASKAQAEEAARAATAEAQKAEEAKEEAERRLKEGIQPVVTPTPEELAAAKKRIEYREDCFHFAVAGVSGSGKSSLVNAFRGLRSKDAGAAPVGVTETTLEMNRYPDTNCEHPFVWYDIPGAGTIKCRDWQYFNEQGLYVFDCILLLFDNRFTMTDVAILVNARRFNIPTYIVRSKSDQHIRNTMREMGYDSDGEDDEDVERRNKLYDAARKQFIAKTRKTVQTNLKDANLPDQRVYIVSNVTMLNIVLRKAPKRTIDEADLLGDLLKEAYSRRGARSEEVGPSKEGDNV